MMEPTERIQRICRNLPEGARVLELGTKRSIPDRATHHGAWLPEGVVHVKSDFDDGADVDVLADCHRLEDVFEPAEFDVVLASSVWEHLERPWQAADQLAYVTKPGGAVWVATHQTFPLHGYPSDFFRFSDVALASLFTADLWTQVTAGYGNRCQIIPPATVEVWNPGAPCWLNVAVVAVRR